MPEADGQSVFQDVLQVEVDTSKFDADLSRVTAAWDAAMKQMQAASEGVSVPTVTIGAGMDTLGAKIDALTAEIGNSYQTLSDTLTATMARAEVAIQGVTASTEEMGAVGGASFDKMNTSMGAATVRMAATTAGAGQLGYGLSLMARSVPVLAEALSFAFVPIAIMAVVDVVTLLTDKIESSVDAVRKANSEWDKYADSATHSVDAMQLQNLKLEDQISKLEGGPQTNHLLEAVLESKMAVDQLSKSIEQAIEESDKLMAKDSVSFFQSMLTGKASTSSVLDTTAIKDAMDNVGDVVNAANKKLNEAYDKRAEAQKSGDKDLIAQAQQTVQQMQQLRDKDVAGATEQVTQLLTNARNKVDAYKKSETTSLPSVPGYGDAPQFGDANKTQLDVDSEYKNQTREIDALQTRVDSITTSFKLANEQSDLLMQKGAALPTQKADNSQLADAHKQFKAALDELKTGSEQARATIKQQMDASVISVATGENQIIANYKQEEDQVRKLIQAYIDRANAMHNIDPKALKSFVGQMQDVMASFHKQEEAASAAAEDKIVKARAAIDKAAAEDAVKERQKQLQIDVASVKQGVQEGIVNQTDAIATEMAATKAAHEDKLALLQDELAHAAADTQLRQSLEHQINMEDLDYQAKRQQYDHDHFMAVQQHLDVMRQTLQVQVDLAASSAQQNLSSDQTRGASSGTLYNDQTAVLQAKVDQQMQAAENAWAKYSDALNAADGQTTDAVQKLKDAFEKAAINLEGAADSMQSHLDLTKWSNGLPGWDGLNSDIKKVSQAFNTLEGVVKNVFTALSRGGNGDAVAAGIGGLGNIFTQASQQGSGMNVLFGSLGMGGITDALGPIGAGLGLAGGLISTITGMFTAAAQRIGKEIGKEISDVLREYEQKQITLGQTIQALEQERQDAINRLSGKKGGQDQLNKILPQIDDKLGQLNSQAQQIQDAFTQQLTLSYTQTANPYGMAAGAAESDFVKKWMDITKQVKDYVDSFAPGANRDSAAAVATIYLNEQRDITGQDMLDQVKQNEKSGIDAALQLNDLYDQRLKIQDQINKLQVKTEDSIERREASAITAAQAQADQKKELQDQLDKINQQIGLQQKIVDKYQAQYGFATDLASLNRLDQQFTLDALDQELAKYKEMAQLLANMAVQPNAYNGTFSSNSIFDAYKPIPGMGTNVNITINQQPGQSSTDLVNTLSNELYWSTRSGNLY